MLRTVSGAAVVALCVAAPLWGSGQEKPSSEKEKIEALIKHVEGLKGAVFIRNDVEYDASAAARFMRGKWRTNERDVKTAKDFVEKVASKSGTTGKAYFIRLKKGEKERKAGEYLSEVLKKLEKKGDKKDSTRSSPPLRRSAGDGS